MDPRDDLLELSILYDTARGFLGLRDREDILSTVLLSLMGACGARFALYLERDEDDRLLLAASEGLPEIPEIPLRWTRRMETTLRRSPGPICGEDIRELGAAMARAAARWSLELVAPLGGDEGLRGIVALGPKLLGEPYEGRDIPMVRGIVDQATLALEPTERSPAGSRGPGPDPARRIRSLRRRHPSLVAIRGDGPSTLSLFEKLIALAEFDLPVLILGETGTGKELVAHAIHDLSRRRRGHFEAINCAAIPRDLMASALFGHEKGAFTGADSTVRGAFERSSDGTIFLDEIGDMPLETQAILLRVLQERGFRRVGGTTLIPTNARVISATNRDLLRQVEDGRFRRDLYYRLQMYTVGIRPLRERKDEIPALAEHILATFAGSGADPPRMSPEFLEAIRSRELKGNVRELESLIAGAIVHSGRSEELRPEHLPEEPRPASRSDPEAVPRLQPARLGDGPEPAATGSGGIPSYASMEREYIRTVLDLTGGNKREAARLMGIPRTTLHSKIKRFGMETPRGPRHAEREG